jgi:hypothetical protein
MPMAQITKARKLIEAGERVEDAATLWNVGRTTLYRALAGYMPLDSAPLDRASATPKAPPRAGSTSPK